MKMKSYYAATVEAALKMATKELGPEAMLVNSRRTGADTKHLGEYEVVFALISEQGASVGAPAGSASSSQATIQSTVRAASLDKLSLEVSDLKRQMERMASTLARSSTGHANLTAHPELAEAFALLTAAEVEANLAYDIVSRIGPGLNAKTLQSEIQSMLPVDPHLGRDKSPKNILALVGPPGSGKTTCLVKLAARFGLAGRRPSQILSADTFRIAAADQLRSYAAILGIGFQITETTASLAQAIEEHSQKELILIDTPGFSRQEMQEGQDLARLLSSRADIDVHLVLPASMRGADMARVIDQYEIFRPAKLLFTRRDETETFGPILNQVVRTSKAVSFVSNGQQIPEDLDAATSESLAAWILNKGAGREGLARTAAAA